MTQRFFSFDSPVVEGNQANIQGPNVSGALEAIVISNNDVAANAGRTVSVICKMATGLSVTFGPLAIGAGQNIFHPRKLLTDAALANLTGVYGRYFLAGNFLVTTTGGAAGDRTVVRLITEQ